MMDCVGHQLSTSHSGFITAGKNNSEMMGSWVLLVVTIHSMIASVRQVVAKSPGPKRTDVHQKSGMMDLIPQDIGSANVQWMMLLNMISTCLH